MIFGLGEREKCVLSDGDIFVVFSNQKCLFQNWKPILILTDYVSGPVQEFKLG